MIPLLGDTPLDKLDKNFIARHRQRDDSKIYPDRWKCGSPLYFCKSQQKWNKKKILTDFQQIMFDANPRKYKDFQGIHAFKIEDSIMFLPKINRDFHHKSETIEKMFEMKNAENKILINWIRDESNVPFY